MRNLAKNLMAWALLVAIVVCGGEFHAHAQTGGGYPSNPYFNKVTAQSVIVPIASGANPAIWLQNGNSICVSLGASCNSSAVAISPSGVNIHGLTVPTQQSGTGTLSYVSGCSSGSASAAYSWAQNGNVVTVAITSNTACTATTANIVYSGLPQTPTHYQNIAIGLVSNSLSVGGYAQLTAGSTNVGVAPFTGNFSGASGINSVTFSYILN